MEDDGEREVWSFTLCAGRCHTAVSAVGDERSLGHAGSVGAKAQTKGVQVFLSLHVDPTLNLGYVFKRLQTLELVTHEAFHIGHSQTLSRRKSEDVIFPVLIKIKAFL